MHAVDLVAVPALVMGAVLLTCSHEISDLLFTKTPLGVRLRRVHLYLLCTALGAFALASAALGLAIHNS